MRYLILLLAFAATALAGYVPRKSGGNAVLDLAAMSTFTGSGAVDAANVIADKLAASGLTGGTVWFPVDARPGNYLPAIKEVQFLNTADINAVFVIYGMDNTAVYEIGCSVDGSGTNWINSGGTQIQVELSGGATDDPASAAQACVDAMVFNGVPGVSIAPGRPDTIVIETAGFSNPPDPIFTGNLTSRSAQDGGYGTATRRASITTLLSRGWSVSNAK